AGASSALTSPPTTTRTITTTAASAKPTRPATSLHTDIQVSPNTRRGCRKLLISHRGRARFISGRQQGHVVAERRHPCPNGNGRRSAVGTPPKPQPPCMHSEAPRPHACTAATDLRVHPHSITSSARATRAGGTARSSALAVLRLMTRSNLVGCLKDKSPSPRAQRIHFAFNSLSKMLVSPSTAARHSGRSHAGLLGDPNNSPCGRRLAFCA